MLAALARFMYRRRLPVLVVFLLLFPLGAVVGGGAMDALKPGGYEDTGSQAFRARARLTEQFGVGDADLVAL